MQVWRLALQRHDELRRYWRSPIARDHMAAMFTQTGLLGEAASPDEFEAALGVFVAEEAARLHDARTWALSADAGALVAQASDSMPAETVEPTDLPTPNGFVLLEDPVQLGNFEAPLRAFHWCAVDEGGVVVTGYYTFDEAARLAPVTRVGWEFGQTSWDGETEHRLVAQFVKALWTISQQTITSVTEMSDRASLREADRRGLPAQGLVHVVTLRRQRRPTPEDQQVRDVDWARRWVVSGHWRNQYLPSSGTHRQQWIEAHVKGPEDKPLVVRDEVTYLRR